MDTENILSKIRALPLGERKRFAVYKSRAINRLGLSLSAAVIYAAKKVVMLDVMSPQRQPHKPVQSALSCYIRANT